MATGRYSGSLHLGRRVWMGFGMQQMQQWTGIMAIATYSPTIFSNAGFSPAKVAWMSGLCNSFGPVGTLLAVRIHGHAYCRYPTETFIGFPR